MLEKEAKWIAKELRAIGLDASPLLNVGSSTLRFRTIDQPYIHKRIISPFELAGGKFLHLDMKEAEGIDLIGDLMDLEFRDVVRQQNARGVLCSNLLEHVRDPATVCRMVSSIVRPGGYILITVPYRYPYHSDPIDTMFRPDVAELSSLFIDCELVRGEILTIEGTSFFRMLIGTPRLALITIIRAALPFYKPRSWWHIVAYLPDLFKPFQITCATFRKNSAVVT